VDVRVIQDSHSFHGLPDPRCVPASIPQVYIKMVISILKSTFVVLKPDYMAWKTWNNQSDRHEKTLVHYVPVYHLFMSNHMIKYVSSPG